MGNGDEECEEPEVGMGIDGDGPNELRARGLARKRDDLPASLQVSM